ncbi:hypothetical protein [Nitrosophilus kaiyonis]|uniref:hypothetical protein n=1 Tax=Nitrosophilus kaiyonis TaxID=2930200 RepID=UPI002492B88D|nr:hypothetical protein [Nitrosophilus kaiyonis]
MKLIPRNYLKYKFFNSLFTGLSVGSIFVIYEPLNPSLFSLGGIILAIGMIIIAKFYEVLLNIKKYFLIGLFVEFIMLLLVIIFLISPYNYMSALFVYAGYQLTFMFGAYLVRAETLIVHKKRLLTLVDISKQVGYLFGMAFSFLFYKILENLYNLDKKEQVYDLHFLLFFIEIIIIYFFIKSFKGRK